MPSNPNNQRPEAYASLGGFGIISARGAIDTFRKNGFTTSQFEGRVNSFTSPLGEEHGHGWLLMSRKSLDQIDTSHTPYSLKFGIGEADNYIEFQGIYVIGSERLERGKSQADESLLLVEIVDTRYYLNRKKLNVQYNCRLTGGLSDGYATETLDTTAYSSVPWTWLRVIEDLWDRLHLAFPTLFPTFSARPDLLLLADMAAILPENLRYDGVTIWEALNDAARRVGCAIVHDNVYVNTFYLARLGRIGTEPAPHLHSQGGSKVTKFTATTAYYSAGNTIRPIDGGDGLHRDGECFQSDAVIPEQVLVYFPTSFDDQAQGELDSKHGRWFPVQVDGATLVASDQCDMGGRVPLPNFNSGSQHIVYETKHARFSTATSDNPSNLTSLEDRAKSIAKEYYRTLVDCAPMRLTYAGFLHDDDLTPVVPGKTVSGVTWSDYGGGFNTYAWRDPPHLMPTTRPIRPGTGGGGGGKIWFSVLEVSQYMASVPGCEFVRALVTQVSCGSSAKVGDEVMVFDPHFCWFNLPIVVLMQFSGTATLAVRGTFNLQVCGVTIPDCFWAVDSACCLEEVYG